MLIAVRVFWWENIIPRNMKTLSESDQARQVLAEDAVRQLNVALKSLQLYPPEHVVSRQATEGLLSKLRAYFSVNGRLDLGIDKNMISLDGSPLAAGNRAFIALARDLFQLKLEAVSFGPGVDARQIEALLSVLCMDPEEAEEAGGAVELLWHKRTDDITISEAAAKQVYEVEEDTDKQLTVATDFRELQQMLFQDQEVSLEDQTRLKAELFGDTEHLADFLSYIGGAGSVTDRGEIIAEGAFPRIFSLARYDTIDDRNHYFRFIAESLFHLEPQLISAAVSALLRTDSASTSMARRHLLERLSTRELCDLLAAGANTPGVTEAHIVDALSGLVLEPGRFDEIVPAVGKCLRLSDIGRQRLAERVAAKQMRAIIDPFKGNPEIVARLARFVLQVSETELERLQSEVAEANDANLKRSATVILRHLLASETNTASFGRLVGGLEHSFEEALAAGEIVHATTILETLIDESRRRSNDVAKASAIKKAVRAAGRREVVEKLVAALDSDKTARFPDVERFATLLGNHGIVTLLELLADEKNAGRRNTLCKLLVSCSRLNLTSLGSKVLDHRWYLVRNVVSILGQIGDTNTIRYLRQAASHRDPRVRLESVRALSPMGSAAFAPIKAIIYDENKTVRLEALKALGMTRNPAAEPILLAIAARRDLLNRNLDDRLAAIDGLGHLRTAEAISFLKSLARSEQTANANLSDAARACLARFEREAK